MTETILETIFAVTALTALHLILGDRHKLLGCLLGLATQPFWFWIAYRAESLSAAIIAAAYTGVWARGAWRAKKEADHQKELLKNKMVCAELKTLAAVEPPQQRQGENA